MAFSLSITFDGRWRTLRWTCAFGRMPSSPNVTRRHSLFRFRIDSNLAECTAHSQVPIVISIILLVDTISSNSRFSNFKRGDRTLRVFRFLCSQSVPSFLVLNIFNYWLFMFKRIRNILQLIVSALFMFRYVFSFQCWVLFNDMIPSSAKVKFRYVISCQCLVMFIKTVLFCILSMHRVIIRRDSGYSYLLFQESSV